MSFTALSIYAALRLQEVRPSVSELLLQRIWFEEGYTRELLTTEGEKIQIIQPGFWNHMAGPDFLHCSLLNGKGEKETGSVELHIDARDWQRHAHEDDPAYEAVILHVFWESPPGDYFIRTAQGRPIRQVSLQNHLRLPLHELTALEKTTSPHQEVGAQPGPCSTLLKGASRHKIAAVLEDAGRYRFMVRQRLWKTRVRLHGVDQALWLGLAESLGYSRNQEAFAALAQHLRIDHLRQIDEPLEIEALLFGMAGFLPERTLPAGLAGGWAKSLWDCWWKYRAEEMEHGLPKTLWHLQGIRPQNRPERRLAVLAAMVRSWPKFRSLVRDARVEALHEFFAKLTHPFWSRQATLVSKPSPHPIALLGPDRITSFVYNTALPAAEVQEEKAIELLRAMPAPELNRKTKIAAVRVLNTTTPSTLRLNLLEHEGLLQIYQDFCASDSSQCTECTFPKMLTSSTHS